MLTIRTSPFAASFVAENPSHGAAEIAAAKESAGVRSHRPVAGPGFMELALGCVMVCSRWGRSNASECLVHLNPFTALNARVISGTGKTSVSYGNSFER